MRIPEASSARSEWPSYLVAFVVVAGLGAVLRSVILNWIVGPALVVLVVVAVERWRDHREGSAP